MKRALLYLFVSSLLALLCHAETPTTAIKVDQAGYLSSSPKVALVSAPGSSFAVKRASDGATVLQGKLSAPATDQDTGDTVQAADFSSLKTAGNYYLEVAGVGRSWPFAIGPGCLQSRLLSGNARLLWTTLRNSGGHGSRVCRVQTSGMSSQWRVSRVFRASKGRAPTLADGTTPAITDATS